MNGVVLENNAMNPDNLSLEALSSMMELEIYDNTAEDEVLERCKDMDAVIITKRVLNRERLEKLPRLKYIGVTSTGYNNVDVEAARELRIAVTNVASYSTEAVAQHAIALLLSVTNDVRDYNGKIKEGEWEKTDNFCFYSSPVIGLDGKVLGVVGLGEIGRAVARIAKAFNMEVVAYSPHSKADGIRSVTLDELLKISDVVSLHMPLTPNTRAMFNADLIAKMKSGAVLLNTARGGLVDSNSVEEALKSGKLSYYLADGYEVEPPRGDNPLLYNKRAIITPHIGWATDTAKAKLVKGVIDNFRSYIDGGRLNRIV